jgi:hypothetical protein
LQELDTLLQPGATVNVTHTERESALNSITCELYGLTPEEIAMVQGVDSQWLLLKIVHQHAHSPITPMARGSHIESAGQ